MQLVLFMKVLQRGEGIVNQVWLGGTMVQKVAGGVSRMRGIYPDFFEDLCEPFYLNVFSVYLSLIIQMP